MTPQCILLAANDGMGIMHPHKTPYLNVLCKIMNGDAPDNEDMSVIVQAVAMCPILCTLDLQDAIDWINERFGTEFTITGK